MNPLQRLEEIFSHFPGIGPRQARRFVHYLQGRSPTQVAELVKLIGEVKSSTIECSLCHHFFIENGSGLKGSGAEMNIDKKGGKKSGKICNICADPERDQATLMIVARDSDLESVEKSGAYKGLYFVLGGTVPILDKEPEKKIRLKALLERVTGDAGDSFKEIILSLNTTPDGDHTANIVKDALKKVTPQEAGSAPKVTILGRGLSTGAELEYADGETIKNALGNRK